ncbi:MAG TPA: hypothetical protein VI072_31845 [Polyangiaceae bacterium]
MIAIVRATRAELVRARRDLLFGDNVYVTSVSAGRFNATSSDSRLTCIGDSSGPSTRYIGGYYLATGTHRGSP